ncbi:hypothetical protein EYC84_003657 [Monilinia fructicola]|uniref:Uncharacterized protein n=1 Tax=Monilinia fructicola TaxID=38448 RepID=A0A5M9JZK0_MONFR|nr:hypothetical protein EYC84_003657 [Monilinia fructicola]
MRLRKDKELRIDLIILSAGLEVSLLLEYQIQKASLVFLPFLPREVSKSTYSVHVVPATDQPAISSLLFTTYPLEDIVHHLHITRLSITYQPPSKSKSLFTRCCFEPNTSSRYPYTPKRAIHSLHSPFALIRLAGPFDSSYSLFFAFLPADSTTSTLLSLNSTYAYDHTGYNHRRSQLTSLLPLPSSLFTSSPLSSIFPTSYHHNNPSRPRFPSSPSNS